MRNLPGNNMECPAGHGPMELRRYTKRTTFRDVPILYDAEKFVCPGCGLEAATPEQTAQIQKAMAEAYRKSAGLLTGEEIRRKRKELGWSQEDLARRAGVGVASIKRWEKGLIQTESMDKLLRKTFETSYERRKIFNGNRTFSIPRIKLVLKTFEKILGRKLLNKKGLYAAKYLFYADMLAFLRLGRSITGACYARLPHGPQLNNYLELVDEIKNADEKRAEPLTEEELLIIRQVAVAEAFPEKKAIYDASHREPIVEETPIGEIIPYTDAPKLKEITPHAQARGSKGAAKKEG